LYPIIDASKPFQVLQKTGLRKLTLHRHRVSAGLGSDIGALQGCRALKDGGSGAAEIFGQ
jgi:hypothetical protein